MNVPNLGKQRVGDARVLLHNARKRLFKQLVRAAANPDRLLQQHRHGLLGRTLVYACQYESAHKASRRRAGVGHDKAGGEEFVV